jgi:hypothetical protein
MVGISVISLVSFNTCNKEKNTNDPSSFSCCQNIRLNMDTSDWDFFSEKTLSLKSSGRQTHFNTSEGIKLLAQTYRHGSRINTKKDYCIKNSTIEVKWKAYGSSQFADFRISLYYDKMGYGGDDSKRIDFTSLTTANIYNRSALIEGDIWYYTRIVVSEGSAIAYTSKGNYDNAGGHLLQTRNIKITGLHSGYLAARVGDPYGGDEAFMVVAEYKIRSND